MKTLPIAIELSTLAIEASQRALSPEELLDQARDWLSCRQEVLGQFLECYPHEARSIGSDMAVKDYELRFEKQALSFQFACFRPRGVWELQGFAWAA